MGLLHVCAVQKIAFVLKSVLVSYIERILASAAALLQSPETRSHHEAKLHVAVQSKAEMACDRNISKQDVVILAYTILVTAGLASNPPASHAWGSTRRAQHQQSHQQLANKMCSQAT